VIKSNYIKITTKMGNSIVVAKFQVKKRAQKAKDLVHDNDKNHSHWHLKDNENFSRIFYKNQKECPQTSDGKKLHEILSTRTLQ